MPEADGRGGRPLRPYSCLYPYDKRAFCTIGQTVGSQTEETPVLPGASLRCSRGRVQNASARESSDARPTAPVFLRRPHSLTPNKNIPSPRKAGTPCPIKGAGTTS